MGILENFSAGIANFGHDAQAAIDQATRNTASFAGSGFNGHKVTGPMAELLGSDPHAFILNLARKQKAGCRQLCVRIAQRNQKSAYALPGNRKITARPPSNANANQIALTLVCAVADAPATAAEEAGRMANGLDVKARGLNGFTVFPISMPQSRGLVEGIPAPTPIDAAVLAIAIPIIAAIAAAVLPGLISAATGVIEKVTKPAGESPEQQAARAAAEAKKEEEKSTMTIVVVVVVVLLLGGGVVYAVKHKRKAA